jgi:tetratricopeptide (TPR) repeat protein
VSRPRTLAVAPGRLRGRALQGLLAILFAARVAGADTPPSVWDVARDPDASARWSLHVRVERMLSQVGREDDTAGLDAELRLEAARAMLEEADAAHSPDLRLRFDLGTVYYELGERQGGRLDLFQRAVDVLAPAVDLAPPDDLATTDALQALVYAYAKMNRPHEELATWHRTIPRLLEASSRVVAMMNMGEAEMRLGLLDDALGTFREVLRLCGDLPNSGSAGSTYVLTLWDLAVALDRSGDPGGALDAAAKASSMTVIDSRGMPSTGSSLIARDPDVFFVPEWERQWYLALAAAVDARDAKDARDAAASWAQAEEHWGTYVEKSSAEGARDLFLGIARVRKVQMHARRLIAEKAAAKLPRRPRHPVEWEP